MNECMFSAALHCYWDKTLTDWLIGQREEYRQLNDRLVQFRVDILGVGVGVEGLRAHVGGWLFLAQFARMINFC